MDTDNVIQLLNLCSEMTVEQLEKVAQYVFKLAVTKSYEQGKDKKDEE